MLTVTLFLMCEYDIATVFRHIDLLWMMGVIDVIAMCICQSYNIPPDGEIYELYVLCADLQMSVLSEKGNSIVTE